MSPLVAVRIVTCLSRLLQKPPDQPRHHLRGKILERRRRPAIQSQTMDAIHALHRFERNLEVVGVAAHRGQRVGLNDSLRVT